MTSRRLLLTILLTILGVWKASAEEFDSDGVPIHYTVEGTGEPVILIHGYRATGDINWRLTQVVRLLKEKYQVITLDNRGHGKSGKPTDPKQYGVNMAEDIVRLMDHLQIKTAHLVGYSMGGMITLKVLATHPERVRSAVIGGMGWSDYQPRSPVESSKEVAPLVACSMAFGELGISREALQGIKVPMTVIIGTEDRLRGRVDALHEIRPDVPIVLIEGANHTSCNFRKEFRQGIRDAVDAHAAK